MNEKEMLNQLHELIEDRKSFICDDKPDTEIFKKDILALKMIISKYEKLIKYLEDKIKERKDLLGSLDLWEDDDSILIIYQDILERLKGENYE